MEKNLVVALVLGVGLLIGGCAVFFRSGNYIESQDDLKDIAFNIYYDVLEKKTYTKTYIRSGRRLPKEYSLTVNNKEVKPQYYNSGLAAGYSYTADLSQSAEYTLLIQKNGEPDIRRVVVSKEFTLEKIPDEIFKSRGFEIPMKVDAKPEAEHIHVLIENTDKKEGATFNVPGKKWNHGKTLKLPATGTTLKVNASDLADFKTMNAELNISLISKQTDGKYIVRYIQNVVLQD